MKEIQRPISIGYYFPEGEDWRTYPAIKVPTTEVSHYCAMPLEFAMYRGIEKVWSCELGDNSWATFDDTEMYNAVLTDRNGNIVGQKKWNPLEDGDFFYQALYLYCMRLTNEGKKPKGIVIGTHDGAFGEWAPVVQENLTDACLVEASQPQFAKLVHNYQKYPNVKLVNQLITTEGQDIEFFEGGKGYTNSVVERVIRDWETEEIKSSIRSSCSINDLIGNYIPSSERLDWLHLDAEGYDADLLRALKPPLPPFIIFENHPSHHKEELEYNEQQKKRIQTYLRDNGYDIVYGMVTQATDVSCLATLPHEPQNIN